MRRRRGPRASARGRACGALLYTSAACHNRGADGLPRRPIMSSSCAATTEINCTRPERSPLFAMYGGWIDRFRSESLTILTCDVDNWKKAAARHERPTSSEQELPDAVPFSSRRYCGREACLDSSTRPRRCTLIRCHRIVPLAWPCVQRFVACARHRLAAPAPAALQLRHRGGCLSRPAHTSRSSLA